VRADTTAAIELARQEVVQASEAYAAVAATGEILAREYTLLDKAARAGALDAVARALALRRLEEAGARLDEAVRDLRVARAHLLRQTAGVD
jgi:hypothetical protein